MYTVVYHSATGNTRYLAKRLGVLLGEGTPVLKSTAVQPETLAASQQLIIMYPIHGFNAAKEIVEFVKQLPRHQFSGVHFIAVGCTTTWLNAANSTQLRTIVAEKQATVGIDRVLAMPLTIGVKFKAELATTIIAEAEQAISQIAVDLQQAVADTPTIALKSKLITQVGKVEQQAAKLFGLELMASDACTACGLCAKQCPTRNIVMSQKQKPKFKFNCSMCLKCIYECPTQAITPRVSKFIPIKGGYSLQEYLDEREIRERSTGKKA